MLDHVDIQKSNATLIQQQQLSQAAVDAKVNTHMSLRQSDVNQTFVYSQDSLNQIVQNATGSQNQSQRSLGFTKKRDTQKKLSSTRSDDPPDIVYNSAMKPSNFEFDLNKSKESRTSNRIASNKKTEVLYS